MFFSNEEPVGTPQYWQHYVTQDDKRPHNCSPHTEFRAALGNFGKLCGIPDIVESMVI